MVIVAKPIGFQEPAASGSGAEADKDAETVSLVLFVAQVFPCKVTPVILHGVVSPDTTPCRMTRYNPL